MPAVVDTRGEASAEVQLEPIRMTLATCPDKDRTSNLGDEDPQEVSRAVRSSGVA